MVKRETLNTSELLVRVGEDNPTLTKTEVKQVYDSLIKQTMYAVADGYDVNFYGFGSFYYTENMPSKVKDVHTGKIRDVKKTRVPRFKSGTVLKSLVRGG